MWVYHREHLGHKGAEGSGNRLFMVENYEDQPWGTPTHYMTNISCWNTSTGKLIWQITREGSAEGPEAIGENSSVFLINDDLVCYDSNGSLEWNAGQYLVRSPVSIPEKGGRCGLLFADDSSLMMIDGDGVRQWQYQFDSSVESSLPGQNGSYIAITSDYVISIHKPVLSTTMNYFVVLLAIDLFVTLMSIVRMVDMIWPQSKSQVV
jgi:outer membrane protein assembly factor BamB